MKYKYNNCTHILFGFLYLHCVCVCVRAHAIIGNVGIMQGSFT
jgi:hypothetical protein